MKVFDLNGTELKPLDRVTVVTPNGEINDRIKELIQIGDVVRVVLTFGEDLEVMNGGTVERYFKNPDQIWN